ncbi:MAG: SGNH/GDSL hydrolase family protein [Legionella sp.]|nr:SGNH/GDSL hydrolase family protein [Legionella sp.]
MRFLQNLNRVYYLLVVAALLAVFYLFGIIPEINATSPVTWMDYTQVPAIEELYQVSESTFNESNEVGFKPDCENKLITTRPYRVGIQTQQTLNGCWHTTNLGLLARGTNSFVKNGSSIAGPVSLLSSSYLRPTPTGNMFLEVRSGTSNNYVKFHYGAQINTITSAYGTVTHALSTTDSFTLVSPSNTNIVLAPGSEMNYSDNGKWATAVTTNYAMFRINLETKQILNFGAPQASSGGWNPFMKTSVTDDGRYAVVTVTNSTGNQWMRVYDLNNCQDTEHSYLSLSHANCQYRDLESIVESFITGYNRYTMAEFADNERLVFYHYNAIAPITYKKYMIKAPNSGANGMRYLALGDSFSSGEGAYSYEALTDIPGTNSCHLSTVSYPYLINNRLAPDSFRSIACSGAKVVNVVGGNGMSDDKKDTYRDNQYFIPKNADPLIYYGIAGYFKQIEYVSKDKPNVVTITITGNDIGFKDKLLNCVNPGTCYHTYEQRYELAKEINNVFYKAVSTFRRIKSASLPEAKIYAVGYPLIAYPEGECGYNVKLNQDELLLANKIINRLNLVIKQAADNAGVKYLDVENALEGSRFCESNISGNTAINGVTFGNDTPIPGMGIFGNESYHPNQLGHRKLRDTILAQSNNLTVTTPAPDSSKTIPAITNAIPLLNDIPPSNNPIRESTNLPILEQPVIFHNQTVSSNINGLKYNLKTGTQYQVWLNSTPVQLGTFVTSDTGNLNIESTIPNNIPAGFHTLRIYGTDINNQSIDLYQTVYVGANENDWDGDNIANEADPCIIVEPSGIDEDHDGIDDACDAVIGQTLEEPIVYSSPSIIKSHEVFLLPDSKKKYSIRGGAIIS